MGKNYLVILLLFIGAPLFAQQDSILIRKLYSETLQQDVMDINLKYLTSKIGARIAGSVQAKQTVEWAAGILAQFHPDSLYLQPVMVPHWVRGEQEFAGMISKGISASLDVCALGGSVGTNGTLTAQVVEVRSWNELSALDDSKVKGKIVFFNRAMDAREPETFNAYLSAVDQRSLGAIAASKKGAVGAMIRSLTLAKDDYPHTGALSYEEAVRKIPVAALSTNSADNLSKALKADPFLQVSLEMNCVQLPDELSYNVIAELKGHKYPQEIVSVGAHLDSWDLGEGASDDGTGIVQAMEVLRLFTKIGITPERTLRIILYMNEEAGAHGGKQYASQVREANEVHVAAIESDAGGFIPRGFRIEASPAVIAKVRGWSQLLVPYHAGDIRLQQRGVDLVPMKGIAKALLSLDCDDSRLFYIHHSALDTYDQVNPREVQLGAGAMAAMAFLFCKYGL
ncbi:M20/M25/M40 family metallo-hydrolase [Chitinophaga sancti]|uniref:Carboxypeptidase Q n=2 Tax=Chitinophaga sancti TaxID=1004 RepID=A0A1K1QZ97_9BACT|nr:M20/M25/M40 family metallo-hydrolase [Chitinophaga sancti]WQG92336.1 M20/M25/M40 family metallo-hydrolase [Chitinophaga sancti]SFW65004.1 Peptidase family M28 [Chitinophaga sancti]